MEAICDAVKEIKSTVGIRMCASLGLLKEGQASQLKKAGIDRFNHNLETSENHFAKIATTHSYADRVDTVEKVHEAGMESCCGGIIGMGESHEDIVDMAFALEQLGVESIPVNFLDPRPGTAEAERNTLTPEFCLKVLALFRFVHPTKDLRVAGGREVNLGDQQATALRIVNSMFTDGYLTTDGNCNREDIRMIEDAGFEIEVGAQK